MPLDLAELCERSGVTARTVRYYVQQGLLPSPGLGGGARYGAGHLARLRLIRRLQSEHLPLAEIRRRLEALDDHAVETLLREPASESPSRTSALEYVRAVLAGRPAPEAEPPSRRGSPPAAPSPQAPRAQWERIAVTADVEVHVRRPLSREDNRRLEKLLEAADRLFRGEEA